MTLMSTCMILYNFTIFVNCYYYLCSLFYKLIKVSHALTLNCIKLNTKNSVQTFLNWLSLRGVECE